MMTRFERIGDALPKLQTLTIQYPGANTSRDRIRHPEPLIFRRN